MRPPMSQLMRAVRGLPVEAPSAPAAGNDTEVLARELSRAFLRLRRGKSPCIAQRSGQIKVALGVQTIACNSLV